jgi:hypothetical protein
MWKELRAAYSRHRATLTEYRGGLRRLRPFVLDRDAKRRFETLKSHSEAVRRLRSEHERIAAEIRAEENTLRRHATSAARHRANDVREFVNEARDQIANARRDVSTSFPDALNGVTADGMINLAALRVQTTQLLSNAGMATLLATYKRAIGRNSDPGAYVEAEVIEDLVLSGAAISTNDADRVAAKELRELVTDVQDLRLPSDVPDLDDLLADLDRLESRADAIGVQPLADDITTAAYDKEREAMGKAGEASDADDQADVIAEIAGR